MNFCMLLLGFGKEILCFQTQKKDSLPIHQVEYVKLRESKSTGNARAMVLEYSQKLTLNQSCDSEAVLTGGQQKERSDFHTVHFPVPSQHCFMCCSGGSGEPSKGAAVWGSRKGGRLRWHWSVGCRSQKTIISFFQSERKSTVLTSGAYGCLYGWDIFARSQTQVGLYPFVKESKLYTALISSSNVLWKNPE